MWQQIENRLIQINYPGSGNYSQFTYDARSQLVKLVEMVAGSVVSTKQSIWQDDRLLENRDATGAMVSKFYPYGQTISGANYFYAKDHLGSVRTLCDSTGTTQAVYSYDPFGNKTKILELQSSDYQFTDGCYFHSNSGLLLAQSRQYSTHLSRWLNHDPMGESQGLNLYCYVDNRPTMEIDPSGLFPHLGAGTMPELHPPFRNCIGGDLKCCGFNRNKCEDRCPPCTPFKEALKRVKDPDWPHYPTTGECFGCCAGQYNNCKNQIGRIDVGNVMFIIRTSGEPFWACAEPGSLGAGGG